jgi:hypothetical protein
MTATMHHRRITLIARPPTKPDADWNHVACNRMGVVFVESVAALRYALVTALQDVAMDIGRVIVDRAGSADDFLELLTEIPAEFMGDALFIRDDGTGIMSAAGRGGDRVLYGLMPFDVRFYLEAHDLVTGRLSLEISA